MLKATQFGDLSLLLAISAVAGSVNITARGMPMLAPAPAPEDTVCGFEDPAGLPADAGIHRIDVAEASGLVETSGVTFVDARARPAFDAGHVPGAISVPADAAAGLLEIQSLPIPPDDLVITYCEGEAACEQGEYLGVLLRDRAGCNRVQVLDGGWQAWTAADAPIELGEGGQSGG